MAPTGRPRGRGRARGRTGRVGAVAGRGGSTATSGHDDQLVDVTASSAEDSTAPATPAAPAAPAAAPPVPTQPTPGSDGASGIGISTSASVAMPPSNTRGAMATRARGASVAVSSSAASGGSKFKPRAVRRGDAERERLAQEELKKQNIKLAEDQRIQRARGRGRRARGRGDAMGRGGFDRKYAAGNSAFGNPGATSSGFKGESGFRSSGYRDHSNRLNTDMFNGPMMDEYEDEPKEGGGTSSSRQTPRKRDIMPMGITRREPKKKELVVATTAEMVAKEKAAIEVDDSPAKTPEEDLEMKDDGSVWPSASNNNPKVEVKDADGKSVEVTEIDDRRLQRSAELNGRVKTEEPEEKKIKQSQDKTYQSREEETRARQYNMLLREFGPRPDDDSKDGRLYLFQFPPTLPPLRVVHRPKEKNPVKQEPVDDDDNDQDVVTMGQGETVDLTEGGDKKSDSGDEAAEDDPLNPYPDTVGYVGKMVVRKSGLVEMDWGGFPFKVMPGITTNFITNAVLLEEADKKAKQGEIAGKAYGMGQIMGRFTVRPVYSKPEPAIIEPDHLEQLRRRAAEAEEEKARLLAEKQREIEPLLRTLPGKPKSRVA